MKILNTTLLPVLMALLLFISGNASGQAGSSRSFTLKEAQDYAVTHHYSVRNAQTDLSIARKKIWETTAIGLPQINASVSYQDMIDIPTTLLPDFITPAIISVNKNLFGLEPTEPEPPMQFFPAKFGTQHNLTFEGSLSQLIFNGQYLVGLQASRVFYRASEQSLEKTKIEIRQSVTQTYYLLAVVLENRRILNEGRITLERTVYETRESYKSGFVEDILVDQMQLNLTNLDNAISALDRQAEIAGKLLKFQMGIDINENIGLSDNIEGLVAMLQTEPMLPGNFRTDSHIDYKLMETQEKLQWLNMKRERSTYLPTLSAFFTRQERAMRDQFDFFDGSKDWFPATIIGFNISIPIFTSGMQHAKVSQARMNLEKVRVSKTQLAQGLQLAAEQARTNYNSALDKFKSEGENLRLADNIYAKTRVKFAEGLASSTELTQVYNQYLTTQSNYYSAVFELLKARAEADKAYNNF